MGFGPVEAIVIVVIVLVIFGAGRLTGVGKALGQGLREFREEASTKADDDAEGGDEDSTPAATSSKDKS